MEPENWNNLSYHKQKKIVHNITSIISECTHTKEEQEDLLHQIGKSCQSKQFPNSNSDTNLIEHDVVQNIASALQHVQFISIH